MKREIMADARLKESLAIPDLTDPKNGVHAINLVLNQIRSGLVAAYAPIQVEEYRVSPIVSVQDNFDALLIPPDNAGRSSRYTRYVAEDTILRTHTTVAIPLWLKTLKERARDEHIVIVPGMCYRRDVLDKTHCGEPHQMDVWLIKKGVPKLDRQDLVKLVSIVVSSILPNHKYRMNSVVHPYTVDGIEVEVMNEGRYLEVLECGLTHPTILKNAGLDPEEYSGLALGMGLDRLVMLLKDIDDIRILRSEDPRIKAQMTNLKPYVHVSNQPPAKRVLSYSTSVDKTEEDVCEEIRDVLGKNALYIENIKYEEIQYKDLHESAKENLGIRPNQKNVVVEITLRSLHDSLPRKVVNEWMRHLYPKLNEGIKGYM